MRVDIFIEDKQVDTFEDETIQITDSIQNAQDPNKIFTSFSKQFSLPATNRNNDIFKHFYDFNIVNGYDAKRKVKALIKINGIDFRKGFIQLNSVKLKNNKATSYNVFFTGVFSELKEVIRDDRLSDLPLSQYDHNFNVDNVNTGFQNFANVNSSKNLVSNNNGVICYPFISHTRRYIYSNLGIKELDENNSPSTVDGIDYLQLKPAIRLTKIIEVIENKYGITFNSDFFESNKFSQLFMWLHRNKGQAVQLGDFNLVVNSTTDLNYLPANSDTDLIGSDGILEAEREVEQNGFSFETTLMIEYDLTYSVIVTGSGNFDYEIINDLNGSIIAQESGLSAEDETIVLDTVTLQASNLGTTSYKPHLKITTTGGGITTLDFKLVVREDKQDEGVFTERFADYEYSKNPIAPISEIVITDQIPQMKVIDFLISIFKMFNLTGTADDYGVITIKPLDDFIAQGKLIDLTNKVDISESTVSKVDPFSRINFEYAEQKTFLAQQRNIIVDREFGSLTQELNNEEDNFIYTGGDYDVNIGFEHMLFERLINQTTNAQTNVQFGWFVDEKQDPTFGKPLIFYALKQDVGSDNVNIKTLNDVSTYIRPSNTRGNNLETLNFGTEIDEFTGLQNPNSLFANYYKNYVERVYDQSSRLTKISAYLPFGDIINYSLEDVIVIQNKRYSINKIDININTGKVDLELLNL